ncbi:ribonuclease H-like domain-containing protein [Tanacetum coccineum]
MPSRPDLSFAGLDDSVYKTKVSETKTSISKTSKDIVEKPKTVRPSAPIIEEWDTDSDNDSVFRPKSDQTKPKFTKINFVKSGENVKTVNKENTHKQVEYPRKSQSPRDNRRNWNGMMTQKLGNGFEFIKKACFVCGSFNHLIKDCDFHDNKMVEKPVLNNKGRVTGQREIRPVWNNAQRVNHQNKLTHPHPKRNFVPTAVATKSGQVPVNAAKQNSPRATTSISTARTVNTATPKPKVNDALPTTYSYFKAHSPGNPQYTLQDQGIFDSGCSRHMTRNKSFLTDYQEINGGFVAFGGSHKGDKITQKGKIRTGKLDFEDVYFVKELKFNLFSVLQMCDKKNSVLFTETEYLVLSPDFKLLDESQVLLKVPRHDNMYSFNLKNVVPSGVIKPHNKTLYELLHGRPPSISFVRPFGCPVTILNTLDPLGKFDGKADEGFLVGYSINSKAFRVFNTRTRKVEENLHITFLENKPNVAGSGPDWLFDIDLLTNSMNYELVIAGNQTNRNAEDAVADDAGKKTNEKPANEGEINDGSFDNVDDLLTDSLMPDLEDTTDLLNIGIFCGAYDDKDEGVEVDLNKLETTINVSPIPTTRIHKDHPKDHIIRDINSATQTRRMTKISEEHALSSEDAVTDDAGKKTNEKPANEGERNGQEKERGDSNKEEGYATNTNRVSTVSPSVSAVGQTFDNVDDLLTDSLMPDLEDTTDLLNIGIFSGAYDDEDDGVEADLNNLETTINVNPIPTTRIHKDHPKDQIIRDINSATQTRRMTKFSEEHALVSYINKQRRTSLASPIELYEQI